MENTQFMTGYEKRLYSGWEKTAADLLKDNKMVANTVRECLGVEVESALELETGERKNVPFVVQLVGKLLAYWYDHPEKIDLKVLSNVLGETKQEVALDAQSAADIFRGVAVGSKNDSNSKSSQ